jgi:hypothetical protein
MDTPLNAAASTAGSIISASEFEVPPYQREYSWQEDEVREFFEDLQRSLDDDTYFLGLIILTDEDGKKKIVDGQQRIVTLTLLAAALFHEARSRNRGALADRLSADFLYSIDYETDGSDPRVVLTDPADNETLQYVIANGEPPRQSDVDSVSAELCRSFVFLRRELRNDLRQDPFKRLGKWTEFITHRLYFAVFIHPSPASAYQVFEVINTRGRDLTTADLLKNFTISQSPPALRASVYERWKSVADNFQSDGVNFVQYIRHAVTVGSGHILSKDLFSFLAARSVHGPKVPPTSIDLLELLEQRLPLYLQMMDSSLPGPASDGALSVFEALNRLNVIQVRPLMMAMFDTPDTDRGLEQLLRLVTRRIVVGNLGTGNIERRFAEAARRVHQTRSWQEALGDLSDLSPEKDTFKDILQKRTLNKGVLSYLKNAICSRTITPSVYAPLHFIVPKSEKNHPNFLDGELSYWGSTIGNTFLSTVDKRLGAAEWSDFKRVMLPTAAPGEFMELLETFSNWDANAIREVGRDLAIIAAEVWYG